MPVSDAALAAFLGRALGRPVRGLRREPWAYASSAEMERVWGDGVGPLLFKRAGRGSRPAFLADLRREPAAYALLPAAAGAPRCVAADPARGWLALEPLDGVPLWQAGGLGAWETAAERLAALHAAPLPAGAGALLRHDGAHLGRWVDRALAHTPAAAPAEPAARAAVARLAALPPVLIHGEAYASNVVVAAGTARLVDWETAGPGPAVLDLAALTSGRWDADERDRVVAAYRAAAGDAAPDDGDLAAARLLVAMQWLGWSRSWTPPPEHRHDWLGEALAVAA